MDQNEIKKLIPSLMTLVIFSACSQVVSINPKTSNARISKVETDGLGAVHDNTKLANTVVAGSLIYDQAVPKASVSIGVVQSSGSVLPLNNLTAQTDEAGKFSFIVPSDSLGLIPVVKLALTDTTVSGQLVLLLLQSKATSKHPAMKSYVYFDPTKTKIMSANISSVTNIIAEKVSGEKFKSVASFISGTLNPMTKIIAKKLDFNISEMNSDKVVAKSEALATMISSWAQTANTSMSQVVQIMADNIFSTTNNQDTLTSALIAEVISSTAAVTKISQVKTVQDQVPARLNATIAKVNATASASSDSIPAATSQSSAASSSSSANPIIAASDQVPTSDTTPASTNTEYIPPADYTPPAETTPPTDTSNSDSTSIASIDDTSNATAPTDSSSSTSTSIANNSNTSSSSTVASATDTTSVVASNTNTSTNTDTVTAVCPAGVDLQPYANSATANGTEALPYFICTPSQLYNLMLRQADWSSAFILQADIDLSSYDGSTTARTLLPIGTDAVPFGGKFQGNNHVIQNIKISAPSTGGGSKLGFFGSVVHGTIMNLNINTITVAGNSSSAMVGGVAGFMDPGSYIFNSFVRNGSVSGGQEIGGFIGENNGMISQSISSSMIAYGTGQMVGGFAGRNNATIMNSIVKSATVTGPQVVGGFVGNNGGTIQDSYATGLISASNITSPVLGGFVGQNIGSIYDAYTMARVSATIKVPKLGGFAGIGVGGLYTDCYWITDYVDQGLLLNLNSLGDGTIDIPNSVSSVLSANFIEVLLVNPSLWYFHSAAFPQLLWAVGVTY